MKFFSYLFGKSELKPKEVGLIISPSLQEFVRTEVPVSYTHLRAHETR